MSHYSEYLICNAEFLEIFVDYQKLENKVDLEKKRVIFYWAMPHIPVLLKFIGKDYSDVPILSDYFSKMMFRINASQLTFYLNQVFQSLEYQTSERIESFLLKYSDTS